MDPPKRIHTRKVRLTRGKKFEGLFNCWISEHGVCLLSLGMATTKSSYIYTDWINSKTNDENREIQLEIEGSESITLHFFKCEDYYLIKMLMNVVYLGKLEPAVISEFEATIITKIPDCYKINIPNKRDSSHRHGTKRKSPDDHLGRLKKGDKSEF